MHSAVTKEIIDNYKLFSAQLKSDDQKKMGVVSKKSKLRKKINRKDPTNSNYLKGTKRRSLKKTKVSSSNQRKSNRRKKRKLQAPADQTYSDVKDYQQVSSRTFFVKVLYPAIGSAYCSVFVVTGMFYW